MAKVKLTFLGTGPTGGVKGQRLESSCLIETPLVNVLIDISRDFKKQSQKLTSLDAVFITHAHIDVIGGIKDFLEWQIKKGGAVPILSLSQTIAKIKSKFKKAQELLDLHPINAWKKIHLGDLVITPFKVKHSIQKDFPTLGFHFSLNGQKWVYASDVASWNKRAEKLMAGADVLIIDGAMWGKKIASHLTIQKVLPKLCAWPVKKIIFTQIGHTAPKQKILQQEIQKICPKSLPAYDGMELKI
ncbi:MBL fold metallo-hydrolase [Candidatus Daviesbacteria bacterium]|nr:MBL fold metallo-hydrolase [Candidatus Daviesbacteria bacterium]